MCDANAQNDRLELGNFLQGWLTCIRAGGMHSVSFFVSFASFIAVGVTTVTAFAFDSCCVLLVFVDFCVVVLIVAAVGLLTGNTFVSFVLFWV